MKTAKELRDLLIKENEEVQKMTEDFSDEFRKGYASAVTDAKILTVD